MTLTEIESIQAERKTEEQIIVVHFEPWNFTDTNQLLTQFFIRLANEFQNKEDRTLTKIGKALEKYSDLSILGGRKKNNSMIEEFNVMSRLPLHIIARTLIDYLTL